MRRIDKPSKLFPKIVRGRRISLRVDGQDIEAFEGESVASALLSAGIMTLRLSHARETPRGLYCGMGVCYECLVTIDGLHAQRACVIPAVGGMVIETCKEVEL